MSTISHFPLISGQKWTSKFGVTFISVLSKWKHAWVRHLTNNSQNLFTVWTNIWMSMYFTLNEIYCNCYKPILMPFLMSFSHWGGRTTLFPFSLKIRKLAPFILRLCHTPSFLPKIHKLAPFFCWGHTTHLPFLPSICHIASFFAPNHVARGPQKASHVLFPSKMRAQHKKHASKNASKTWAHPPHNCTAPPLPYCDFGISILVEA